MTKEEENQSKPLIIGIDDAGRGPVLGPMVLAGCLIEKNNENELKRAGAKDSKLLSPKQREEIRQNILKIVKDYKYKIISPVEIDTGMGEGLNLNQVEALASASIINEIAEKLSDEQKENLKIILDCPSINTAGWKNQLMDYVKDKTLEPKIICEHKADFNYVVVSAASIIAKTTRDGEIEKMKKEIGIDFGSGYPADPFTKEALIKHKDILLKHRFIRESWATWKVIAGKRNNPGESKKGKQTRLFE